MIVVYRKFTPAQIRKDVKINIKKIAQWFEQNPKRRVCRAELWYGQSISIKKATIKEQLEKAAEEAIAKS